MTAERDVRGCRHDAARRIRAILDIAPFRRMAGFGMNVEPILLMQYQRQFRQKTPLRRAEPAARPLDGGLGLGAPQRGFRSEEHTSELQSRQYLVCRPLLEKKASTTGVIHPF